MALERSAVLLEQILQQASQANTAVKNLELRAMNQRLTGAEAGRLVALALQDYSPHGPPSTWRVAHPWRTLLEIIANWKSYLETIGVRATPRLWSLVMESGYSRALEEYDAVVTNEYGEDVELEEKISFWRRNIPEAGDRFLNAGDITLEALPWRHYPGN
jgi:hypothetical protein